MNQRMKKTEIYNNWQMFSPDGILLARCSHKRAEWYLKRDIAVINGEKQIKLKFMPNGLGNNDTPFLLEEKANTCVVCGIDENLNRHHVVPYQYRKWMPNGDKEHSSYDVLPICVKHHDEYEAIAQKLSIELSTKYDAPFSITKANPEDVEKAKMYGFLRLIANGNSIPVERMNDILSQLSKYFSKPIDYPSTIDLLKDYTKPIRFVGGKSHGEAVVEKVLMINGLQEFIQMWRKHFIKTMNPKFLSENWDINHMRSK